MAPLNETGAMAPVPQTPTSPNESTNAEAPSPTASSNRFRSASLKFLESSPPSGMWHATGNALAQAPTPMEIRKGSFSHNGWDGTLQRRNSTVSEESIQRLSRVSSAQTPGSLNKTLTNTMASHPEADNEGDAFPKPGHRNEMSNEPFVPRPPNSGAKDDDEDPFSKFIGRGRIDSQGFEPRKKAAPKQLDEDGEIDLPDEEDSLDGLDPRPKKRQSAIPKKFLDPDGDDIPKPDEKVTVIASGTGRPSSSSSNSKEVGPNADGVYPNGYKFPPKHTWGESTVIGLKAFWKFTITPLGFLIVIYGLNVVAWGGMLFLLLIGGGQQFMCFPPGSHGEKNCNDLYSPRRIWIEIDSQILNALFCVTGFGLIPWRFRDLYYLLQYRLRHKQYALRKLAGIHRAWFRLPGNQKLDPEPGAEIMDPENNTAVPLPTSKAVDPPLTGFRATDTRMWKLDFVIWAYVVNTFLQVVLSVFMWHFNRFARPSWSTGLFVALACIVAGLGGLMCFLEGKRIKAVEGIPVEEEKVLADIEQQVVAGEKGKQGKKHWKGKEEESSEKM